jgi:acyl transferase domain-containing protein/acyl carrier protein
VPTTHAFHSPLLAPIADALTAVARTLTFHPPQIPYLSNVTGTWITDAQATDPAYWAQHLCQPVQFADGIAALLGQGEQVLLDVGLGQALSSFVKQHPACSRTQLSLVLPTLPSSQERGDALAALLGTLGKLWLAGVAVDWAGFAAHEQRRRVPLPTYPFERQRFWIERQAGAQASRNTSQQAGKKTDIADWFYTPAWHQSILFDPAQPFAVPQQESDWLMFVDESGLGVLVAEQLIAHDCHVVTVKSGAGFIKHNDREYTICPDQPEDYQRLLRMIGYAPKTIIHLWSLTPQDVARSNVETFDQAQRLGFYSLLYLVKALGSQLITSDLDLWIVTRNVRKVTGVEALCPEHATLAGASIVIAQENLNITCRQIDVDHTTPGSWQEQHLVGQLLHELAARSPDLTVAYRGNERWIQTFEPLRLPAPTTSPVRHKGVYLITGGLGGIGLTLAEHLAKTVQARIILTTRSAFPPKAEWPAVVDSLPEADIVRRKIQFLQTLEGLGAEVLVVRADVADQAQMQRVLDHIQAQFGTLHGVIHTAGISDSDGFIPIQDMTRSGCELHFASKVHGLYTLEQVLATQKLDFCILFSSLAAVLGGLGFIGYSAANSFMDAFAHQHNQRSPNRWISIDWDTWQTKENPHGDLGTTVEEYAMTKAEAIQAFERMIATRAVATQCINSTGDLQARFDQWVRLVSFHGTDAAKAEIHPRPELMTAYVPPSNETETIIADIWQAILGLEVGSQDNFFELGGNSLIATQVIARLRRAFQLNVPLTLLFDAPTVAEMAMVIEMLLIAEIEQLDEEEALRLAPRS